MTQHLSHHQIEELIGAYALDAVDPEERQQIDDHLPTCPRCRGEVADLRDVASLFVYSGAAAPEGVWDRIVASLDAPPPPMRLEVARKSKTERRLRQLAVAAVSVAAAVIIGVLSLQIRHQDNQIGDLRAAGGLDTEANQALGERGSRAAELRSTGGDVQAIAVIRSNGEGYLLGHNLPPLTEQIYQLWGATDDGEVLSLGVMSAPGTFGFSANEAIRALMVTHEDKPVDQPTRSAVLAGQLS